MSEHVSALSLALLQNELVEPLLLPHWWFAKAYVRRDLQRLGIRAEPVERAVRITDATIVNKLRPGHYWTALEAAAMISAMHVSSYEAQPGTGLYLSRKGEKGEGPKREINNDVTEAAMAAAGVKVVRTLGVTVDQYIDLATSAETVFADHGSALYNMMYWKTRRIVELFTPNYWDSAFLFLADALGIKDYQLWQIDDQTSVHALTRRIASLMGKPIGRARGDPQNPIA